MDWKSSCKPCIPKLIVRKANDLVEARTHLTLAERKAFAIAIAFTKRLQDLSAVSEISFDVLQKVLGEELPIKIDKEFKRRLKKVLQGLKGKRELALIEIPVGSYIAWLKENNKEDWIEKLGLKELGEDGLILCGVIDSIAISSKENKIIVKFNSYITPLVFELKRRYTSYELKYILLLDLKHSPIFYELFKKNEKLGKFKISLDKLREILGVADKPTYKLWGAFLKKILIPSLEEINEKTDIEVNFETGKGAHGKVEYLVFYIRPKYVYHEFKNLLEVLRDIVRSFKSAEENISLEEFAKILLTLKKVNPSVAIWFLLHYPEGEARLYAWEHIQWVDNNPRIKYPDRYLESLIKDKNPELEWLLDQRTKDLIREELEKLTKGEEEKEVPLEDIELLVQEIINQVNLLEEKSKDELKQTLGVENFKTYLQELVQKRNLKKLREVDELVRKLLEREILEFENNL